MSQIYMIAFLPVNFPSVAALDKWGLRSGLVIGISLTTLGLWLRCLINVHFAFVIAGQTVLAIAQPFIYNAPAKLSANWFGEKERIYATSIGANANLLGVAIGYFVPALFVGDNDTGETAKQHVFHLMISVSVLSTLILLPVILTFQDKPPSFPSLS